MIGRSTDRDDIRPSAVGRRPTLVRIEDIGLYVSGGDRVVLEALNATARSQHDYLVYYLEPPADGDSVEEFADLVEESAARAAG